MNKELKTFLTITAIVIGAGCTLYTIVSKVNELTDVKKGDCYSSESGFEYTELTTKDGNSTWWADVCTPYSCEKKFIGERINDDLFYKKISCGQFEDRSNTIFNFKYINKRIEKLESK